MFPFAVSLGIICMQLAGCICGSSVPNRQQLRIRCVPPHISICINTYHAADRVLWPLMSLVHLLLHLYSQSFEDIVHHCARGKAHWQELAEM